MLHCISCSGLTHHYLNSLQLPTDYPGNERPIGARSCTVPFSIVAFCYVSGPAIIIPLLTTWHGTWILTILPTTLVADLTTDFSHNSQTALANDSLK